MLPCDLNGWWTLGQLIILPHTTLTSSAGLRPEALSALVDTLRSHRSEPDQSRSDHPEEIGLYIYMM